MPSRWAILALTLVAGIASVAAQDTASAASGAAETDSILTKSVANTEKLRDSVARIVNKSSEEVLNIKSLLTTNARVTKAMNDLMLEMSSMTSRMEAFGVKMEKCRVELGAMEQEQEGILSPEEVSHPALLQLEMHAETLHRQVRSAKLGWMHASAI
mmetsp:Transcript_50081/g.141872  ORF Transcript_50081/g.141872 Transcript_50081/m.141872 type:complete len:157 (-) Transcript_50081:86-556(-)